MVEAGTGNLLDARVEALVNPVNTVGVMGKGLALEFKRRFPANFQAYKVACKAGRVVVGKMFLVEVQGSNGVRLIVNFPTKQHWRDPSRIEYVRDGLVALADDLRARRVRSVAIPALGCGLGGLDWAKVKPLVEQSMAKLPEVRAMVFAPV
jgi:O-acetyl-ADP-ribose deacetylase (regulator of RNase III)